jgi:hypothetical protein
MTTASTMESRRVAAVALKPGQATWTRSPRQYAVYLRRLADGRWAVTAGWATEEGSDRDYLSERPVAGLEGVCHDRRDYDFGEDFEAAFAYYEAARAACAERRVPPVATVAALK